MRVSGHLPQVNPSQNRSKSHGFACSFVNSASLSFLGQTGRSTRKVHQNPEVAKERLLGGLWEE